MADWGAIRDLFFDRQAVTSAADKAAKRALSKAGAYIRTRAKTSIRKKKGSAPPGQPPHAHGPHLRQIFFGYDERTRSVVVGPVPHAAKRVGPGVVPRLLEFGGVGSDRRGRRTHYAGHPFMRPAFKAEAPKFTDAFKGSL